MLFRAHTAAFVFILFCGFNSLSAHAIPRKIECSVDYTKSKFQAVDFNGFKSISMDFFAPQAADAKVLHAGSPALTAARVYSNSGGREAESFYWYESFNDRYSTEKSGNMVLERHSADAIELHKNLIDKTWTLKKVTYWVQGLSAGCQPREDAYCDDGSDVVAEISGLNCTDDYDLIVNDPAATEELIKSDPCHGGN